MGYARRIWALLAIASLATLSASGAPRRAEQANLAIPFQLVRGHLVVVEGKLGPLSGRRMIVDTGSSPSILDSAIAQELGIGGSASRLELFNSTSLARTGILSSLNLGPVTAESLPVLVSDLSSIQRELGFRIDAIIGLDVLRTSFVIDYEAKLIHFGPVPQLPSSVPFASGAPLVSLNIEVEGQPAKVLVDTGSSGLLLFRKEHRFEVLQVLRTQNASNISGDFQRQQVEVSDVRLGAVDLGKRVAYLANARESVSRDYDGLMSISALGIKQVAFDFERGVLSWK